MKKKILRGLSVIVLLIVGVVLYFVVSDLQQEEKLRAEIDKIVDLTSEEEMDLDRIQDYLNTTVTKGDYAIVEKAFKQYLSDSFDNSMEMAEILNDEAITETLTVENYQEDGPEFTKTKAYLSETKQRLEDCKNQYYEFLTEEKAMSYINDKKLDQYYIDFYQKEVIGDLEKDRNDKTVENSINEIITLLDHSEKVIDFLIENKNEWRIEEGTIVFQSDELSNQYNRLIENL